MKQHLGDILVAAGIINETTLDRALARQRKTKARLGSVLEEMGVITEGELAEALAKQFNFKIIRNFQTHTFSSDVLDLIPAELAMQRLTFPLTKKDGVLAVAITDPFDTKTLEYLAKHTGLQILPVISTRNDIIEAITSHYVKAPPRTDTSQDTVLVVEESLPIATVIQVTFTKEGYKVFLARDGEEGYRSAVTERPTAIITDAMMPKMDGYQLLKTLQANHLTADIPVVMLTSKASVEDEQRALEAGFMDFVPKPVQPIRIVSRVRHAIAMTRRLKRINLL